MNGGVRDLFAGATSYTGLDVVPGPGVDIVADAATWRPLDPDRYFDTVVCAEVLEHTPDWRAIVQTCHDVLVSGGRLILTCAGPGRARHSGRGPWDLEPDEWYRNISAEELAGALRHAGFAVASVTTAGQDLQALARRAG
jgi:SAM-dependent methyltransferase